MRHCLTVLLLGTLAPAGCRSQATGIAPSVRAPQTSQATLAAGSVVPEGVAAATPSTACQARGPLPDPACTPGSLNPAVTPATIHQTICVPGYTTTIRPPVSESNRLKRRAPLAQAQHAIATDWVGAYCAARLPRCRDGVHFS